MSGKFKIIRIDNLVVRKMDLEVGDNIIENDITSNIDDEQIVKEAVKISVSCDDEIFLTPYEGISCYLNNYGSSNWKPVTVNCIQPLKVWDTCLLLPIKIWFRIIPTTDNMGENRSPKRKIEEIIEEEPLDKRCRSEANIEVEPSNYVLNTDCDEPYIISEDSTYNAEENLCTDATYNQELACLNTKEQYSDSIFQSLESNSVSSTAPNNEELNAVDGSSNCNSEVDLSASDSSKSKSLEQKNELNNNNQTSSDTQNVKRNKCKYGTQCYRINTEHKEMFCHPGDADYDAIDNRPECPYGTSCYRKNPQHKLDYKHTRSTRKRNVNSTKSKSDGLSDLEDSMEESIDESDYDPSFIDDGSLEEFDSDSDYE